MGRDQRDKIQRPSIFAAGAPNETLMDKPVPGVINNSGRLGAVHSIPTEYDIAISTGMNTQEEIRTLNDMAKQGFEHYLTVPLYGSTEKMYFRKYS